MKKKVLLFNGCIFLFFSGLIFTFSVNLVHINARNNTQPLCKKTHTQILSIYCGQKNTFLHSLVSEVYMETALSANKTHL